MKAYHVIKEKVTLSSLIVHTDQMNLDYIPLSAKQQQSWLREAEEMLPKGLLQLGGSEDDDWI